MKIMRKMILSLLTTVLISSGIPSAINAQVYESTPVTISTEKVKINGQVCYSHIVLERQTLFSICKAYNVTTDELYQYNPTLKEKGLQKNSILIIPIIEEVKVDVVPAEDNSVVETPVEEVVVEYLPAEDTPEKTHIVKWFEDLGMIAKKYGVSTESIIKINGLKDSRLSKRQKLIIPSEAEAAAMMADMAESGEVQSDSLDVVDSLAEMQAVHPEDLLPSKKEVNLSLLLPFKATGTSGSTGNMDFYSGVLLAVYDMAKSGISCDLNVYDTTDGNVPVTKESLEKSDVIIGPVGAAELRNVLEMTTDAKAVVSPLDQKAGSLVSTFSEMIQAPTPLELQYKDLIDWIRSDMQDSDRFIVITEKGGTQTDAVIQMKAAADSSGMDARNLSYSILEGRNVTTSLEYIMTESGTNRVYIASDSEAFVNDVVRNLNLMLYKKYDVVLYAPSRIRNYETIEVENFHNASLCVSTGYYIDYDDTRTKEFLLKYRALFGTEPTQFAFQGYDLAKYFISICTTYGDRWTEMIENSDASMLQSTFMFRRSGEGGYVNTGVRRIVYEDDWTIVKVK